MQPEERLHLGSVVLGLILVVSLATSACSSSSADPPLLVAAAASLAPAFNEIGPAFTEASGIQVIFSYAATGSLAEQIRNGGPFDVFASADALHVDALIQEGQLEGETRIVFANGVLVLVAGPEVVLPLESINLLVSDDLSPVAIANPTHAPYGLAARQALERSGLWAALEPKIVFAETVRQAAQMVETGNAPVGLVSASTALENGLEFLEVGEGLYERIEHVAAVSVTSSKPTQASQFLSFLATPVGQGLLASHGLSPAVEP